MAEPDLTPLIAGYWGKARPPEGAAHAWHPFLWHSLDVAACAGAILDQHAPLAGRLRWLADGADPRALVTALALVHDLGKLSRFQEQAPDPVRRATGQTHHRTRFNAPRRHTDTGLALWQAHVADGLGLDFETRLALDALLPGVFGHHGVPAHVTGEDDTTVLKSETDAADRRHALTFAHWALTGFSEAESPDALTAPLADLAETTLARLSFLVAAVVNLADWLGSDAERFPYAGPDLDPTTYWTRRARPQAERAVAESGVIPAPPTARTAFADLFPGRTPRPLQAFAETMPLPDGQGLVLVEDVTGSGKTEAADVLAARMAHAGHGRGAYIALPTTATAERMAERHDGLHARMTDGGRPPSLTLVHGGAGDSGVVDAGADEARAWMGADRRRQLAADIAVGTVDQALLAALPARFASARLFGLAPKVLVVDEVHAHDDYTGRLLAGLLTLHAALGGSAILLSATLTAHLKRRLAGAFAHGAGWRAPDDGPLATEAYPAVTVADAAGPRAHPVAAPAGAHRRIPVTVTDDPTAVRDHLLAVARAGGCALWMRNTVDDAIAAYDTLAGEHADVILLHARFPAARRAELEDGIMRRFGPDSRGADRAGAIVVATQVLEQSLDLDFDAMVADLKPIDALLQSAGRMRRHARDANGDPAGAHAGDARGDGALWVFGPRFAAAPEVDWYKGVLPRAAYVYPRIGWLWRTAELLETRGELRQPDDLRGLIEHALPDDDPDLPDGILAAADDALAQAMAERSHAGDKLLQPDLGYTRADGQWPDDERMPTRLGESVELCLVAVGDAGEFLPWGPDGYADGFARVRANLIKGVRDSLEADPRADGLKATLPALRWRVIVPLVVDPESGTWSYTPTGGDAATITYDAMRGIRSCNSGGA